MRFLRIILAAVAVTVFSAVYGMLTCGWLFKWIYQIPPVEVWKPVTSYTGSFWAVFYAVFFILYLILAIVFVLIEKALPTKCRCCSGSIYGLIVWAVGMLPGMFSLYAFTVIAPQVLIYWGISGLINLQITGLIIAGICGQKTAEGCCGIKRV